MTRLLAVCSIVLTFTFVRVAAQSSETGISFEHAMQLMYNENNSITVAEHELELAKNEHQRLNSFWFPRITATGMYVHLSNEIEVKESLSQFTDPAVDYIHSVFPTEELLTTVLNDIGRQYLSVSLFPQNLTTIDAMVTLPVFTGGKRIYAGEIGKLSVDMAAIGKERISADQQILLVETYYRLRLGQNIIEVRRKTYDALEKHYQQALKLEANGMINKAERLYFQVNREEAKRELETATKNYETAQNTFKTILKIEKEEWVSPTSPLFINDRLPDVVWFKETASKNNYLISGLDIQNKIQDKQLKIARSAYLPDIELFGKQTLYSHGIDKNLVPRTMIGGGFVWNIFDGLDREKKIKQAKIGSYIFDTEREKIKDDINVAVDKFYNQTQIALDNIEALATTMELSNELVRTRRKAYAEGMATSMEVIDAELMLSKVKLATLIAYYEFDVALVNLLAISGMPDSFFQYSRNGKDESFVLAGS